MLSAGRHHIPRLHERLHLMLRANVVCRPHFLHPEALGDQPDGVVFLAE